MTLIVKVTSPSERVPLDRLLAAPLGLDVWETRADHLVLQAHEAQVERLERMGYGVEQLHEGDRYLSAFATAESVSGYHSAESMAADLRQLAESHPEIAELVEVGRSVENRPLLASVSAAGAPPRCSSWAATTPGSGSPSRSPTCWPRTS